MISNTLVATFVLFAVSASALEPLAPIKQCDVNRDSISAYADSLVDLSADVQTYVDAVIKSRLAVQEYAKAWENALAKSLVSAQTIKSSQCVEAKVTALARAGAEATTAAFAAIEIAVKAKAKASASLQTSDFSESSDYLEYYSDLQEYTSVFHEIYASASATGAAFAAALASADASASACL